MTYLDSEEWLTHPGSVGRALANARVMVLNEAGEEIERDGVGEIVCRHMYYADFTYHGDDTKRRRARSADCSRSAMSAISTATAISISAVARST